MRMRINDRQMMEPDPAMPRGSEGRADAEDLNNKSFAEIAFCLAMGIVIGVGLMITAGMVCRALFEVFKVGWGVLG
jgi:hypothetical protein